MTQKVYGMTDVIHEAKRIADTLEEILRLVKADQERSQKYMEESKDPFIKTMEEGESE